MTSWESDNFTIFLYNLIGGTVDKFISHYIRDANFHLISWFPLKKWKSADQMKTVISDIVAYKLIYKIFGNEMFQTWSKQLGNKGSWALYREFPLFIREHPSSLYTHHHGHFIRINIYQCYIMAMIIFGPHIDHGGYMSARHVSPHIHGLNC